MSKLGTHILVLVQQRCCTQMGKRHSQSDRGRSRPLIDDAYVYAFSDRNDVLDLNNRLDHWDTSEFLTALCLESVKVPSCDSVIVTRSGYLDW